MATRFSRRDFLTITATAGVAATSAACADDGVEGRAEPDVAPDLDAGDVGDADHPTDAREDAEDVARDEDVHDADTRTDSGDGDSPEVGEDAGDASDAADTGDATLPPNDGAITKGPWTVVGAAGVVRLRVETNDSAPLVVRFRLPDGTELTPTPTLETRDVTYTWPRVDLNLDSPDVPGEYTIQDFALEGVPAGTEVAWTIDDVEATGQTRTPAASGEAFTFAWYSDTMFPTSAGVSTILDDHPTDFALHGGDIQYQSNPIDTWTGYFHVFKGTFRRGPHHFAVGNHEYEGQDEYNQMYQRLIDPQGDSGAPGYHAFTWGSLRFILLNSEEDFTNDGTQAAWLIDELEAVKASDELAYAVVGFHRPYFTFGRARPRGGAREAIHPILTQYPVPIVLTGHNHAYERFEVDGITYIVDGGGGAATYSVDEQLEEVERDRPEELAWRKSASRTFGALILSVGADGTIDATRYDDAGDVTDTFTVDPNTTSD